MKKILLLSGASALIFTGCASYDRDHYYSRGYYRDHPDVVVVQPGGREVVVDRYGNRTYVRDYNTWDRDRNQPRYRGKHPDALGWNDPSWYHSHPY